MENDSPALSRGISGYDSFYKTQTSLVNNGRERNIPGVRNEETDGNTGNANGASAQSKEATYTNTTESHDEDLAKQTSTDLKENTEDTSKAREDTVTNQTESADSKVNKISSDFNDSPERSRGKDDTLYDDITSMRPDGNMDSLKVMKDMANDTSPDGDLPVKSNANDDGLPEMTNGHITPLQNPDEHSIDLIKTDEILKPSDSDSGDTVTATKGTTEKDKERIPAKQLVSSNVTEQNDVNIAERYDADVEGKLHKEPKQFISPIPGREDGTSENHKEIKTNTNGLSTTSENKDDSEIHTENNTHCVTSQEMIAHGDSKREHNKDKKLRNPESISMSNINEHKQGVFIRHRDIHDTVGTNESNGQSGLLIGDNGQEKSILDIARDKTGYNDEKSGTYITRAGDIIEMKSGETTLHEVNSIDKVTDDQLPQRDAVTEKVEKANTKVTEMAYPSIDDEKETTGILKSMSTNSGISVSDSERNKSNTEIMSPKDTLNDSGKMPPSTINNDRILDVNKREVDVKNAQYRERILAEDTIKDKISSSHDNIYFTGRLPSILSRHDSSQSFQHTDRISEKDGIIDEEPRPDASCKEGETKQQPKNMEDKSPEHEIHNNVIIDISKEGNTPTPGKMLNIASQELTEPIYNIYKLSRETPLTPRSTNRRSKSATISYRTGQSRSPDPITEVQNENVPPETNDESTNMTVDDITMITGKVLTSTNTEGQHSKFDDLPHMKHISEYVQEHIKTSRSPLPNNDEGIETCTPVSNHGTVPETTSSGLKHKDKDSVTFIKSRESVSADLPHEEISDQNHKQNISRTSEDKNIPRSSSENDLKAIIASAKLAISNGTETTESQMGFETSNTSDFTLQGDNMSILRRKSHSRNIPSHKEGRGTPSKSDKQEAMASLICSSCLQVDSNVHTAGYCTNCQQYLCGTCITVHTVDSDTRLHEIVPSYCKNELAINKYVPATGYCLDCTMFLCTRCVIQHTGFRANRHHRVIQSSFVSKPKDRKTEAKHFLDEVQDKIDHNDRKSSKSHKEHKRKRKLLVDLDNSTPYSNPYSQVPESLYPGPKKTLSSSYAKNPKWAHSSIPDLPYLVPPKPIPNKAFHAEGHTRPRMIYTRQKAGIDAMAVKLKLLKSRYKMKDESKTHRRREQAVFTARPVQSRENLNLPEVRTVQSHTSGGRSLKHVPGDHGAASETKKVEFINEHCLSIPFPRGEKRAEISGMTVLLNGKLVVLDRNNNNIKLYNKGFHCTAALQFQNRLVDLCASNLCQTDVYAATPKHIYEISVIKGMDLTRKMKVEIKRIEGITHWKYGLAIISKKTNITWELRLLDYRGNLKSKLEMFNPMTLDIGSSPLHHVTSSRGGKYISVSDTRNSCIITVDVTTRVVLHETMLEEGKCPTYLTADSEGGHNLYVTCDNKVFQISRKGKVVGVMIDKAKEHGDVGCIVYNKLNDRIYVQTGKDMISVYQVYF